MPLQYYTFFDPSSGTFPYFSDIIGEINSWPLIAGTLVSLILSLLCCFFGFRLARVLMALSGFVAGCVLGFIFITPLVDQSEFISLLITIGSGIILAALSWYIYKAGLVLLALVLAFSVAQVVIPYDGLPKIITCMLLAIVAAIFVLTFIRPGIIAVTAIYGGSHAAVSLLTAAEFFHLTLPAVLENRLLFGAIISVLGIIVQMVSTKDEA